MSSDAALDAKLTALLRVMVSRLPPNKKLPSAVVVELLRGKYGDTYSDAYLASHEAFIVDTIQQLTSEKEKAATATAAPAPKSAPAASSSSEDDEEESEEDESDDGSVDEEDEEESVDEESDEEEESDITDGSDSDGDDESEVNDDDDDGQDAPAKKKARLEEVEAIAQKEADAGTAGNGAAAATVAERCKAMAECLRKLAYRVRAPSDAETLEDYLNNFLIVEFQKHGMDPEKYSKSDVKRYRIQREVELLQQDGASLALDRRNRAGRGFSHIEVTADGATSPAPAPAVVNKQASMFLDDE